MAHENLIRRVDHNYFHGYIFGTMRQGMRWHRWFSDKPGGRAAALRRARAYRDRLLEQLPPPTRIKRRYVLNTTGHIGVSLIRDRTRKGTVIWRYIAQWPRPDGTYAKATFSVPKYGKQEARRRAIAAREAGLAKLMAPGPARAYQKRSMPKSSKT